MKITLAASAAQLRKLASRRLSSIVVLTTRSKTCREHQIDVSDVEIVSIRETVWRCANCQTSNLEDYILTNDVWTALAKEDHREFLCMSCAEKRLGRKFTEDDFNWSLPGNATLRAGMQIGQRETTDSGT